MAEPKINLNNYKSSGVYTVEIDASENVVLPLTTGRLIIGSSRVGPFNTVVLINDVRTLRAVFGEIDPVLEKAGSYFHRSIEVALREGPVYAMSVLPLDSDITNPSTNLDQAAFTTFNTESSTNNNAATTISEYPIVEFFNRQRLWFAEAAKLNKSKNIALGDDPYSPNFGLSTAESNKILSFANLGNFNMTTWVRKANVTGFDVTAREWYASVGSTEIDFPSFVHKDDFISDYFVEVISINGDWTNHIKLAKDPIYSKFFDASGLIESKASDFFALREVKVINRTIGCLIPDFRDQSGVTVSIDRLVNKAFPTTGLLCSLDIEKLDLIELDQNTFIDNDITTNRIDIVGQGYEELAEVIDDGDNTIAATPLINVLSYTKPAKTDLIYDVDQIVAVLPPSIMTNEVYLVTGGTDYLIVTEGDFLYNAYYQGFIRTGDAVKNNSNTGYIKVTDSLELGGIKYIKIEAFADAALTTLVDIPNYLAPATKVKFVTTNGDEFKNTFTLTNTSFFLNYSVNQSNELVLELDSASGSFASNKLLFEEYFKVNHYIKANTTAGRDRFLRIVSVQVKNPLTDPNVYTITTMAPSVDEVTGIDTASNTIQVYKGISNFVPTLKGQNLRSFAIRKAVLPDGTADRLEGAGGILDYLFTDTDIPAALSNNELVDFRYVVDSYSGTISQSSKYQLAKLAAVNGQAMALVNAPSVQQFEKSVDPSFINTSTKSVSMEYISQGGNLSLNPSFTYKFAEEDVKGVPLSSYASFHFPNLIVRSGSKNISVPQAAYISNLYVRKFKNGTPFLIAAGGKRGALTDPEIVGLEYDLTDDDRDYLEPVGFNLTVKRRGFGIILFSNNTAYQRINSALNNAHVRDNLSTIERDIEKILFNFLFDFNDEITRLRVRTIVENYLDAVVNARGISTYEVIFDSSNNTNEVISANAAIIDIRVDFPRGIQKFINRITITRVGGQLSSDATGFIPSF
jgi:hypothetical protein